MPVEATPDNIRLVAGIQDVEVTFGNRGHFLDLYRAGKYLIEASGVCEAGHCVACKQMDVPMCEKYQEIAAEEAFYEYEIGRQAGVVEDLPTTIAPISALSAYFAK